MVEPNPEAHLPAPNPPTKGGRYMRRTTAPYANDMPSRRQRFEAMQKLIKPKKEEKQSE
jgi:hypothetical protein